MMDLHLDLTTVLASFTGIVVSVIGWLIVRTIKENDDKIENHGKNLREQGAKIDTAIANINMQVENRVTKADFTLFREEHSRTQERLSDKLDKNYELILALVRKEGKN